MSGTQSPDRHEAQLSGAVLELFVHQRNSITTATSARCKKRLYDRGSHSFHGGDVCPVFPHTDPYVLLSRSRSGCQDGPGPQRAASHSSFQGLSHAPQPLLAGRAGRRLAVCRLVTWRDVTSRGWRGMTSRRRDAGLTTRTQCTAFCCKIVKGLVPQNVTCFRSFLQRQATANRRSLKGPRKTVGTLVQ